MDEDIEDYELGNSFAAQKDLMERALATGDEDTVERVLLHITDVRRMAKNGTLEWQRPDKN